MLGAPEHFPYDAVRLHQIFNLLHDVRHKLSPFGKFFVDVHQQIAVSLGVEIFQAQIFQFALHVRNTQSARQRRINFQRFVRHRLLPFGRKVGKRTHVMQPVRKLDDNHADVFRHRHHNLAEIFRFFLLLAFENDFIQFGNARNQLFHFFAELFADILFRRRGIFHHVVQKRRRHRGRVQPHIHQNVRHGARMHEIRLARSALLPLVHFFRIIVRFGYQLFIFFVFVSRVYLHARLRHRVSALSVCVHTPSVF